MHPALRQTMLPSSPFRDTAGGVRIGKLIQALDLGDAQLARTLKVSPQAVSYYLQQIPRPIVPRNKRAREFWVKLDQAVTLVRALTDEHNTRGEIRQWFHAPNRALGMQTPVDLVYRGELDRLIRMLKDVLNAAQGG